MVPMLELGTPVTYFKRGNLNLEKIYLSIGCTYFPSHESFRQKKKLIIKLNLWARRVTLSDFADSQRSATNRSLPLTGSYLINLFFDPTMYRVQYTYAMPSFKYLVDIVF